MNETAVIIESDTDLSIDSSFTKALASLPFSTPTKPVSSASNFGTSDCGEPLVSHHLCLDFTPTDADDEAAQKKCCDFWEYIASRPELQNFRVLPDLDISNQHKSVSPDSNPASAETIEEPKTAISMLQMVEDQGLVDRAFEVKMLYSDCTITSQDYEFGIKGHKTPCKCPGPCVACSNNSRTVAAAALCKELRTWDKRHPKSMDAPGKSPVLAENVIEK